ncbi:MAG: carbohydrate ABC transporter permease [Christensenellales bacterium]|jgi:multiple sugar transport system permease protein
MQFTLTQQAKERRRRENLVGYAFMLPSLLFFLGFVIFPMGMALVTSFTNYSMTDFDYVGFANYIRAFQDKIFLKSTWNTLIIVLVSVPVVMLFSLWVASVVYKMNNAASSFFRIVFYLPIVTGTVAVTVVWKWIFNNYYGLLNYVCKSLGIISSNINWLGNPAYALWCIIAILLTTSIGQPIVLYISALANVDPSLVEASEVDGANHLQVFWKIKWPQIMPTTLYILVITTINSFQCFALIQLLTSGGPNNATNTIMYNIYYHAYKLNEYGYGNAMGILLALLIALFSFIQFRLAKSENE